MDVRWDRVKRCLSETPCAHDEGPLQELTRLCIYQSDETNLSDSDFSCAWYPLYGYSWDVDGNRIYVGIHRNMDGSLLLVCEEVVRARKMHGVESRSSSSRMRL